jgi:predicted phage terminase large subunit-like protein
MQKNKSLREAALEIICKNRLVRTFIARRSPLWFLNLYFPEHLEFETAPFQYEMLDLIQRDDWKLLCVTAFRAGAKTTILNFAHVLWAVLGKRESNFVLIITQTQTQARQQMKNLRSALEYNHVFARDMGPFKNDTEEWGASSIVFTKRKARISVASVNEAIRGIKHLQYRPDLVLIDDPEDLQSAKTTEGRNKIYNWFKGEVLPIGSKNTRFVVLGNVVHERCLVMRLKQEITENKMSGIFKEYPILNEFGESMWPGKFATPEDIAAERKRIGDDRTWYREYLLKVLPEDDQIISRDAIKHYDVLPAKTTANEYRFAVSSVDPAAKIGEENDFTAIVSAQIYGYGENMKIYILANPVNRKMLFPEIIKTIKEISTRIGDGNKTRTYIEGNAAQSYAVQQLNPDGYPVTEVTSRGDKRERLFCVSPAILNAQVLFPRQRCELLIDQLVNFGLEDHDDLSDALVMLINEVMKDAGRYYPFSYGEIPKQTNGKNITAGLINMIF